MTIPEGRAMVWGLQFHNHPSLSHRQLRRTGIVLPMGQLGT